MRAAMLVFCSVTYVTWYQLIAFVVLQLPTVPYFWLSETDFCVPSNHPNWFGAVDWLVRPAWSDRRDKFWKTPVYVSLSEWDFLCALQSDKPGQAGIFQDYWQRSGKKMINNESLDLLCPKFYQAWTSFIRHGQLQKTKMSETISPISQPSHFRWKFFGGNYHLVTVH